MKKTSLIYLIIFLHFTFFISCNKSESKSSDVIYQSWEAVEFISVESVGYPKSNGFNPVIEFKDDGFYYLKLDANICAGSFTLNEKSGITLSAAGCTKICCDSEFSRKFAEMLPQAKSYEINGSKLKLNVPDWGWIELKLNN